MDKTICSRCKVEHDTDFKNCADCRERNRIAVKRHYAIKRGEVPEYEPCHYCNGPVGKTRSVCCGSEDCLIEHAKAVHEKAKRRQRERYAEDSNYRDRRQEVNKQWRDENRELWLESNIAYYRRTYRERAAVFGAAARRRHALIKGATVVKFSAEQLEQRFAMFGGCWMCGDEATTVDHVKPLSKGGPHMLANLRPACSSCNRAKWDHWPYPVNPKPQQHIK